jgi:HAE1 family hydrophobic/amphiphilic exporter-1
MTSLAFIFGILPLVFASGAGSASRHSLGTPVLGGMLVSTILNLFIVPVFYVMVVELRERTKRHGPHDGTPPPAHGGEQPAALQTAEI